METFIIVSITACTAPQQSARRTFVALEKNRGEGGNPEVLNHCFALRKVVKNLCFEHFFPNNSNLLIHSNHGEPIMLAGRGEGVERRVLQLNNDDRVLLYLDVTNIASPLSSNIRGTQFSYDRNTAVVNINTTEIKEQIILKDRKGNVVLEYRVRR